MMVKNQYDGKTDLLKLTFRFHLPETIYRVIRVILTRLQKLILIL